MNKFLLIIFAYIIIFSSGYSFAYDLRITEILVDGSDEFVEITNFGMETFSGSITLSGVKSSPLVISSLSLPVGDSLVLGDNLSMLSSDFTGSKRTGLGLNLGDTNAVYVQLIISGEIIDELLIPQADVQSLDNKNTSFHRLRDGSEFSIFPTAADYVRGSTMITNPGRVYGLVDDEIVIWSESGRVGIHDNGEDEEPEEPTTCPVRPFTVDEVYHGDAYTHYIELLFTQDWEGGLILSGDALTIIVDIPTQSREKNTRYLIATSTSGLLHSEHIIVNPALAISTGQLLISSSDGQIVLSSFIMNSGSSWYEEGLLDCEVFMTRGGTPSPGFDEHFLPYMGAIITPSGPSCPVNPEHPPATGSTGGTGTTGGSGLADLRLSLIDYDPPGSDTNTERIGLRLFSGESVSLSGWKIMYESKTYNFQSGTVLLGEEYIRTANFQMVNSRPVCVNLYYLDTHVDVACYDPSKHISPYFPLVEPEEEIDYANLQFDIVSLVYDPPGSDTDNETITIRFDGGADEVLLDNLRLRIGTKTKRVYGTILSGQTLTLVGNFQMPNTSDTCVALTYEDIVYDEYCYVIPKTNPNNPTVPSVDYSSYVISIDHIIYDPPGSDTDNEVVTLYVPASVNIDFSQFYLSFDNKKRYLKGVSYRGGLVSLQGNYQLPNTKATCVELKQGGVVFDTYCYDPDKDKLGSGQNLSGDITTLLSGMVKIDHIVYDPPGSDKNNESITITVSESFVLQQALYLRFDNKKKKLSDTLSLSGTMTFLGNYQMPNTKAICVELLYGSQIVDTYCYDPNQKEVMLSGTVDTSYWSGLQIARVLPNPKGKDIAKENELIALSWEGGQSSQLIDKNVKLKINTTNITLSGLTLVSGENVFPAGKALSNSPSCLYLYISDVEVDRLCYPQAKDNVRYYHPRLNTGPQTVPDSLIDTLNFAGGNLSKLLLKKVEKKICLTYEGVQIRCMNAGESTTSKKNRALLTLNNAYIARITNLYYSNQLHPQLVRDRLQSYTTLSQKIKNNQLSSFSVYGAQVKPTELQRYVDLISRQSPDEYVLDQFGRSLFGHDKMDEYYEKVYE